MRSGDRRFCREDWADPAVAAARPMRPPGAAGADIRANLPAAERAVGLRAARRWSGGIVPTGLRVEIPAGFEVQIRPRSGLALKHGITLPNTPGTIDSDYRGPLGVLLINLGADADDHRAWRADRAADGGAGGAGGVCRGRDPWRDRARRRWLRLDGPAMIWCWRLPPASGAGAGDAPAGAACWG